MAEDTSNSSAAPIGSDVTPDSQVNGADTSSTGTTPMSGNSTDNGTSTPDASATTPDQGNGPTQPAGPSQQDQAQQPNGQQPGQPNLKQSVENASGTAGNPASQPVDPKIQQASRFSSFAEALTGGAQYKTTIDPNTGVATRTKQPVTTKQLGLALAFEALGGALAGFGVQNGPGNLGRAAAAGGQFGMQQAQAVQQKNQQQDQQANQDFQRHAQVLETNMKLYNNAQAAGRADYNTNTNYVGQFAPQVEQLMKDHPEVIKGVVNGSDLAKYHVTQDSAIPYRVVARVNPPGAPHAGEQTVDSNGKPQWDIQYAIVDPNFKSSGLLTDADKKLAADLGMAGFSDGDGKPTKLPQDLLMNMSMGLGIKSKLATYQLSQSNLNDFYDKLNTHDAHGDNGDGTTASPKSVFSLFGQDSDGKPNFDKLADFIAQHEGSKPTDRNARNNNPGNLVADKSWTGKIDNVNLPAGQTGFRVYDSPDEGHAALLNQLQLDYSRNPNMSPEDFFTKYDKNDATQYAADARKAAGVTAPIPTENPVQAPDLKAAVKADPTLLDALQKFQPFLNASSDNYEKAVGALGTKDPTSAGKILALYGGTNQIRKMDLITTQEQAQAKTAQKVTQDQQEEQIKSDTAYKQEAARIKAKTDADTAHQQQLIGESANEQPDGSGIRQNYLASVVNTQGQAHADLLRAIAEGAQKVTTMGLSRQQTIDLAAEVRAAFPHYDQATANNYYDTQKSLQSTKPLDAANTAIQHLGDFYNTVTKEGYRATNPLLNSFESNYGTPEHKANVNLYNQAITRSASEVEAAYKNGGASLTDKDKEDAKEMFGHGNGGWFAATPSKQAEMAKTAMDLLTAKYSSVDGRLANVMPSSKTPIQDLMTPQAHKAYRDAHDGQDFDAAAQQRENASKYGTWYGRGQLDNIKQTNGGQAGNQQMSGQTNGQTASAPAPKLPTFTQMSSSGAFGWDGKQWVDVKTGQPAPPKQ